jgi:hypothetical protein
MHNPHDCSHKRTQHRRLTAFDAIAVRLSNLSWTPLIELSFIATHAQQSFGR